MLVRRVPLLLCRAVGLLLVVSLLSCFGGVKKTGKVVGYRDGRVLTKAGSYAVGSLGPAWQPMKIGKAIVVFYNSELRATLSTDAFCDQAYNDSSLKQLTRHLFAGLQDLKILEEKDFILDGRGALQTSLEAKLDGIPVRVNTVVIKKDWCLFDFYLVSEAGNYEKALQDFTTFFNGFSYSGDL